MADKKLTARDIGDQTASRIFERIGMWVLLMVFIAALSEYVIGHPLYYENPLRSSEDRLHCQTAFDGTYRVKRIRSGAFRNKSKQVWSCERSWFWPVRRYFGTNSEIDQ